jgi:hypothetical protein
MCWVFMPMEQAIEEYEKSAQECPNIKPGEEFEG